jgi:hypothetical protein
VEDPIIESKTDRGDEALAEAALGPLAQLLKAGDTAGALENRAKGCVPDTTSGTVCRNERDGSSVQKRPVKLFAYFSWLSLTPGSAIV